MDALAGLGKLQADEQSATQAAHGDGAVSGALGAFAWAWRGLMRSATSRNASRCTQRTAAHRTTHLAARSPQRAAQCVAERAPGAQRAGAPESVQERSAVSPGVPKMEPG